MPMRIEKEGEEELWNFINIDTDGRKILLYFDSPSLSLSLGPLPSIHLIRSLLTHFILAEHSLFAIPFMCFHFTHLRHITSHHIETEKILTHFLIFDQYLRSSKHGKILCYVFNITTSHLDDFLICRLILFFFCYFFRYFFLSVKPFFLHHSWCVILGISKIDTFF